MANSRTSAAEWTRRVEEWRESGLTAREFCENRGYKSQSLLWWSSQLKRRERLTKQRHRTKQSSELFKRVTTKPDISESAMVVRVAGAEIVVQRGFEPLLLAQVVAALGGAK